MRCLTSFTRAITSPTTCRLSLKRPRKSTRMLSFDWRTSWAARGPSSQRDVDGSRGLERLRVAERERVGAVAHNETGPVKAQPPSLALVSVFLELLERQVVKERFLRLPGDLV